MTVPSLSAPSPVPSARARPAARPLAPARTGRGTREGLVATVVAIGIVLVVVMWWRDNPASSVHGWGPWLTSAGRLTGLVGTYLIVVEVLLMSRVAWLDRMIGMDRLALWHRRNGEYSITLLVAHAFLSIWGYAVTGHEGLVKETTTVVLDYPDMLAATVGLALLVLIGVLSARVVRRKVNYQTWYFIHLYTYLALALSFAHQFSTGEDFATHPFNRGAWIALYAVVGLLLVVYRVGKPLRDQTRHRLRVSNVVREAPGMVSIYITGRRLEEIGAESGQFFLWRFLSRDHWWQAHPFSLSAAPNGQFLRLTVKDLGDHSRDLSRLARGTRVIAEGPYGAFTARRRRRRQVLLVGGGVGITPLRALFESLPGGTDDVTLIYRASAPGELAFRGELDAIARARRCRVHYLVGSRAEHPEYLGADHLRSLVPDIANRDIYLCGPEPMQTALADALTVLRVPGRQIHSENFEL
jgi:predicted ferric reductase